MEGGHVMMIIVYIWYNWTVLGRDMFLLYRPYTSSLVALLKFFILINVNISILYTNIWDLIMNIEIFNNIYKTRVIYYYVTVIFFKFLKPLYEVEGLS